MKDRGKKNVLKKLIRNIKKNNLKWIKFSEELDKKEKMKDR